LIAGTTAGVVFIRGKRLITANIGDCRAVVSKGGKAMDITTLQNPGREDERKRIEINGGWVFEASEMNMGKLHNMDLNDPWIKKKAEKVVRFVDVFRVNGELAVSRAIGDTDYKGTGPIDYQHWLFPLGHDRPFTGNSLVIPDPEYQVGFT